MSEGSISQAEIDALLSGVDVGGLGSGGSFSSGSDVPLDIPTLQKFSDDMKDKLAGVLKTMTQQEVSPEASTVESSGRDQLLAKIPEEVVAVMADFSAGLGGDHLFIMPPEFATKLVGWVNGEENPNLDDMGLSVISELVSSFSGQEITALSAGGKLPGLATNPAESVKQTKAMIRMPQGSFALFTYPVKIGEETYTLWEAVSGTVADGIAKALGDGTKSAQVAPAATSAAQAVGAVPTGAVNQGQMQMGGMMGMPQMGMQIGGMHMQNPPNVQSLQFPNFAQSLTSAEQSNIGLLMDVFMELTVELGRTKKTIKEILGFGEGTIISLDKLAGEPVDILVNHKPIAKGEVVVIDENFGVRVTEILPSLERVATSM